MAKRRRVMIYKVEIENDVGSGIHVAHKFEGIIDTEDEAEEFGANAAKLAFAFDQGFANYENS
jgi:hypothetical protein